MFFFLLWPRPDAHSLTLGWGDFGKAGWCFFFCCGPAGSFLVSLKRPGGAAAKKKTPRGGVFFFCCGPARTLTHSLRAWVVPSPRRGGVFFFCCGPARTGWCFFFLLWPRPDAHSLTVGWGDFGKAGWCFFFCCGPAGSFLVSLKRPGGAAATKKNTTGRCFFFCCGPARTLTHSLRAWVVPSPRRGGVFFFAAAPPGPGWCFFFCCGPAQTLTHSLWAGAISARFGWCFFFCCGPARSFLVSLKRPGGAAAKKTPRGGVFFLLRPRADAHSLTAGLGGASPSPGWCSFFCCGPARTGVVFFFFAVAPPGRSLTHCGLGRFWQGPGGPPRRSLTHFGLGRFRQGRMVFFFCCGPAGSFLVSLKRPGGAAAKKKTPRGGVFFFAAAPRERSLTHCGPGWCLPLAGVVFFFFCCGPARTGWCFFFLLWPRPDAHSLTVGWGDFGKAGWCSFFCCGPAGSFLVSLKRPGGAAATKKNTTGRCFFFLLRPRADAHSLTAGLGGAFPSPGWCFFFFAVAPPRRSLTHCGLGRFRQGSGGVFFLLWPRLVFLNFRQ